ncbi:MAG: hypothetical protein AAGF11_30435 [Myxococcota bacterium]
MSSEPSTGITPNDLHAYFDDELLPDQAATVAEAIEADPALRTELTQLRGLQGVVDASFDAVAQAVPSARFEQIWDEIDRAIDRDQRLQAEADRNASVWTRLWAALRPARIPALAAAAAAVVTVLVVSPGSDGPQDPANKAESVASVKPEATPSPSSSPGATPAPSQSVPDQLAAVPTPAPTAEPESLLDPMPVPQTHEAEIHGIEFGVRSGRISNNGTVTVLYVEEDDAPTNSERSL